jgi:aldose 1-epimerase
MRGLSPWPTLLLVCGLATNLSAGPKPGPSYEEEPFGQLPDGTTITAYTLVNKPGSWAKIITYGGIITELHVPDKSGKYTDVVLGFDNLKGYLDGHPYFGCITGRVANRIGNAQFTLEGKTYKLAANNGAHSLHGGKIGFDKRVWKAVPSLSADGPVLRLSYTSKNGEEGYPGNLQCVVTYTFANDNTLRIDYHATTDQATPVNLTNHSYFHLAGPGAGDILQHRLEIKATRYTPGDETLLPTGEIKPVAGTPFDFTTPRTIGERLKQAGGNPVGYDLNYVLADRRRDNPELAAIVTEPTTGRVLEVLTTEPGVQFYTGNFLDGTLTGKGGVVYRQYGGFCLEAQHFPDSPNKPGFPSIILKPGETYRQTTLYRFRVQP